MEDLLTPDFWQSAQHVIETLLLVAALVFIVPIGNNARRWLHARFSKQRYDLAVSIIRAAVMTAEQLGYTKDAAEKLRIAIDAAKASLASNGIHLDVGELINIIESIVYDELTRWAEYDEEEVMEIEVKPP